MSIEDIIKDGLADIAAAIREVNIKTDTESTPKPKAKPANKAKLEDLKQEELELDDTVEETTTPSPEPKPKSKPKKTSQQATAPGDFETIKDEFRLYLQKHGRPAALALMTKFNVKGMLSEDTLHEDQREAFCEAMQTEPDDLV